MDPTVSEDTFTTEKDCLFLGEGVVFTGYISAKGKVQISGVVNGEIHSDELWVGPSGVIRGKIQAREMEIHGQLHEDVTCAGQICIQSTGSVNGQLAYGELQIKRGGRVSGNMNQHGNKTF
jgi:cytoskeletal protein CcmA (bactofilin family)